VPVTQEITANGRTSQADAVAAAERAVAAIQRETKSRAVLGHEREMALLSDLWGRAKAPALAGAIRKACVLKQTAFDLGQAHEAAETGGSDADEEKAEAAWTRALADLEGEALDVLDAPFDDLNDVLVRADAFALLSGPCSSDTNEPVNPEDLGCSYRALRRAITEIAEAHRPQDAFEKAQIAYHSADQDMSDLGAELQGGDDQVRKGVVFDPDLQQELVAKQQAAFEARDRAANALLAERPMTPLQLVLQMQIVAKEMCAYDLRTHAKRDAWLRSGPLQVEEMRDAALGEEQRAWALLLENATRLAQCDLSRGWRDLLADDGGLVKMHPNARDVLALAASKELDPERFGGIHLVGADNDHLPQIIFSTDEGHAIAKPGVVYHWMQVK